MDLGKADKMKMTYEQAVSYLYEIPKFTKKNGLELTFCRKAEGWRGRGNGCGAAADCLLAKFPGFA